MEAPKNAKGAPQTTTCFREWVVNFPWWASGKMLRRQGLRVSGTP